MVGGSAVFPSKHAQSRLREALLGWTRSGSLAFFNESA